MDTAFDKLTVEELKELESNVLMSMLTILEMPPEVSMISIDGKSAPPATAFQLKADMLRQIAAATERKSGSLDPKSRVMLRLLDKASRRT